jgi:ADP-ribosylglycohydrolase
MLMGAFLGDALGAPHEFKVNKAEYTGRLEHQAFNITRFQVRHELQIGQVTDDSEMTLALLRTIIKDKGYIKNHVTQAYLDWANSGGWMLGKNTRAIFKGIKTIKGYQKRMDKILDLPEVERSQSNGTLMRASPLALLSGKEVIIEDVKLTNPNPVNIDCSVIYVTALRLALAGFKGSEIVEQVRDLVRTDEVLEMFGQIERNEDRDTITNKGWCLHALWCAMMAILYFDDYSQAMKWVISVQGSDTDTNACIAGALLGAVLGFEKMKEEPLTSENIEILLKVKPEEGPTPRPTQYSPADFFELTEKAYELTLFDEKSSEF